MNPINLFVGYDPREKIGFHVFVHSLLERSTRPVSITPLAQLGLDSGSNTFTLSRFLVPFLMGYKGHAIFLDGTDMMMFDDIAKLDALYDPSKAVQVVKHADYESEHERKYIGTDMECAQSNYPRKNWASAMLVNCAHPSWAKVSPYTVPSMNRLDLLQLNFIEDKDIGEIHAEWNVLIDEGQDDSAAKIVHWSAGIPYFSHYQNSRRSRDWFDARYKMTDTRL